MQEEYIDESRNYLIKREKRREEYLKEKRKKMFENKRNTGRAKCGFCFHAGKPSRKYLDHTDLEVCPTLKKAKCGKCGQIGHTRKHCSSDQDLRIRLPYPHNKRPKDEYDTDDIIALLYVEGDSEDWSDSDEEVVENQEPVIIQHEVKEKPKSWASIVARK
jgi:hypothetical protein